MQNLTPCQLRIVNAVAQHSAENKLAPTIRELAGLLGRTSATVHEQVRHLRLKGWLTVPGPSETIYRAIRLTDEAKLELGILNQVEKLERECRLLARYAGNRISDPQVLDEAEKVLDRWLAVPAGEAVSS